MEKSLARQLEEQLLAQDPASVQTWLEGVKGGTVTVPPGFNWLGFAEITTAFARGSLGEDIKNKVPDLDWAQVAATVNEYLTDISTAAINRHNHAIKAMRLRAFMIRRFGARPGHPILDPEYITNWFFTNLAVPLDDILYLLDFKDFRDLDPKDLIKLMEIRHFLRILDELVQSGHLVPEPKIQVWLALLPELKKHFL